MQPAIFMQNYYLTNDAAGGIMMGRAPSARAENLIITHPSTFCQW